MFPGPTSRLLHDFTWSTWLFVGLIAACSANTERGGKGGEAGSGGLAGSDATTQAAGGKPLTPGLGAGADPGGSMSGDGDMGGAMQAPLRGPAFIDFDCSPDGSLPEGDACATCQQTLCGEELAGALGENWSTGQANGPCKPWFDCLQDCTCNDQACYKACIPHLGEGACATAFAPFDACFSSTCQSDCSSSG